MSNVTGVMTLTDFLLARIAEDEAVARDWRHHGERKVQIHGGGIGYESLINPERSLAECEAKRRIVEILSFRPPLSAGEWARLVRFDMLVALALPYTDHPDYDESWRP